MFVERNGSIGLSDNARVVCSVMATVAYHGHNVYEAGANGAAYALTETATAAGRATDATVDYLGDKIYNATTNISNQFSSQNVNQRCEYMQRNIVAPTAAVAAQAVAVASTAAVATLMGTAFLAAAPVTFCFTAMTAWYFRNHVMARAEAGIASVGQAASRAVIRPTDERRDNVPAVRAEVASELQDEDAFQDLYS